jgi:hypothetical protein
MRLLKALNPTYKLYTVPAIKERNYVLRLPVDLIGKFVSKEAEVYAFAQKKFEAQQPPLPKFYKMDSKVRYKVQPGDYLLKIANKFKVAGRKSSARSYANKALGFQPSLGRAYLLIANLYADSANDCGDTQFNKRAVYWLAADVARKAGKVNSSLKKVSNKTAESYTGRAPSKTDIFTEGNAGVVIKFDCWINRSVTVPSL